MQQWHLFVYGLQVTFNLLRFAFFFWMVYTHPLSIKVFLTDLFPRILIEVFLDFLFNFVTFWINNELLNTIISGCSTRLYTEQLSNIQQQSKRKTLAVLDGFKNIQKQIKDVYKVSFSSCFIDVKNSKSKALKTFFIVYFFLY